MLLIICSDVKSNPGSGSDKRVRVLYSNIRGLPTNLDELAVAGSVMMFWFVLSLKSLRAASLALVANNRGYRTPLENETGKLVPTNVLRSRYGDKQWFDASCGELMMLSRLLIVPDVEHAVQIIGVNLHSLVLRTRGSMVLQGSHIMNEAGIL